MCKEGIEIVNLLSFTKKLSEKIRFYDDISKDTFSGLNMINPFAGEYYARPVNITVIWVDDCEKDI